MLEYRAEGLCRNANHLRREELYHCITTGEVLQSTALAFDTERRLRFELGGQRLADGAGVGRAGAVKRHRAFACFPAARPCRMGDSGL